MAMAAATTPRLTAAQVQQFHDQGFVIVRGAFSRARVARLRQAVEGILARATSGEATAISWINEAKQLPDRMGDFMADPSHFSLEFTDWLAEDAIPHLQQLIANGETSGVRHCRFQMLAGGDGQAYRQGWHRDQRFVDPEGHFGAVCDAAGAAFRGRCVEWNAPLVEGDSFFNCVPGSHRRPNTDEETAALLQDRDAVDSAPMPGATVVRMEPGDVCYFDAGMLHRGWNPEGRTRWTL
jgi:ectoine hydroxylase-related dioxygenase (phytanoyl-CoA dioxygenase family)